MHFQNFIRNHFPILPNYLSISLTLTTKYTYLPMYYSEPLRYSFEPHKKLDVLDPQRAYPQLYYSEPLQYSSKLPKKLPSLTTQTHLLTPVFFRTERTTTSGKLYYSEPLWHSGVTTKKPSAFRQRA